MSYIIRLICSFKTKQPYDKKDYENIVVQGDNTKFFRQTVWKREILQSVIHLQVKHLLTGSSPKSLNTQVKHLSLSH